MSPASTLRNVAVATICLVACQGRTSSDNSAPATVAQDFIRALDSKDWSRAVQFIHQEALENFRADQLKMVQEWPEGAEPRPAVRAHADSIRVHHFLRDFHGIPTMDSLGHLPPSLFLERYWQSRDRPPHRTREVLGALIVSDTVAYVLYRMTGDKNFLQPDPYILEARRSNKRWLLMLNWELECLGRCWIEIEEPDSS